MKNTALARRYATALIKIGTEDKSFERIGKDLRSLIHAFTGSPEIYKVLLNPMYKQEQRMALAGKVSEKIGASDDVARFLAILVEGRKVRLLPDICDAYFAMEDDLAGRLRVTVESPVALDKKLMGELTKKLHEETKKEIILTFVKKEDLIGGLVLKVGNTVLDGSLRAQLGRVSETMQRGV